MSNAWKKLNKASRDFQRNPSPENERKLKAAKRAFLEDQAKNTEQPKDKP